MRACLTQLILNMPFKILLSVEFPFSVKQIKYKVDKGSGQILGGTKTQPHQRLPPSYTHDSFQV